MDTLRTLMRQEKTTRDCDFRVARFIYRFHTIHPAWVGTVCGEHLWPNLRHHSRDNTLFKHQPRCRYSGILCRV